MKQVTIIHKRVMGRVNKRMYILCRSESMLGFDTNMERIRGNQVLVIANYTLSLTCLLIKHHLSGMLPALQSLTPVVIIVLDSATAVL